MRIQNTEILGESVSGVGTCLWMPEFGVVFDMGICPTEAQRIRTVLITHGHVDHMAGIIQHAFTRNMMGMKPSRFIVPPHLVEPIHAMFALWEPLQHGGFKCDVRALAPGEEMSLGKGLSVKAFVTDHTVEAQGYAIFRKKRKLKPEFKDLPGKEIGRLRQEEGVEVTDEVKTLEVVYTGDTRISTLDRLGADGELLSARIFITEATFLTDEHSVGFANDRGHTHLFQLAERAQKFENVGSLVLTHFSARYRQKDLPEAWKALPDPLRSKTTPLPGGLAL